MNKIITGVVLLIVVMSIMDKSSDEAKCLPTAVDCEKSSNVLIFEILEKIFK